MSNRANTLFDSVDRALSGLIEAGFTLDERDYSAEHFGNVIVTFVREDIVVSVVRYRK